MLRLIQILSLVVAVSLVTSCTNETVAPTNSGFKGTIYFSNGRSIYNLDLAKNIQTELFTNAQYPEMTKSGKLLIVSADPPQSLKYSDLTGANQTMLLETMNDQGPLHKRYILRPRISFDQKYIAYDGDKTKNPMTFIIDSQTGDLIASIGNNDNNIYRSPYTSPSWFPDGSLVVEGKSSINNGIYKVSKDFKTITRIDLNLSNLSSPSVSPDGNKIAFISNEKPWIMNADGSNAKQLYTSNLNFKILTWSPDSKYIAAVERNSQLFIIDPSAFTIKEIPKSIYVSPEFQLSWVY